MRGQQRTVPSATATTLKAFVRVSKNSDAPLGKDGAKPTPMRVTRSRSAALAAPLPKPAEEVPKPSRKRKLTVSEETAKPVPAKKQAVEIKKLEPAVGQRKKRATTISAYFSPTKAVVSASTRAAVVLPAPVVAPEVPIDTAPETVSIDVAAAVESLPLESPAPTRAKLNERAGVLLTRLRNRKPVSSEPATAEETREIQDDLRSRRIGTVAAAPEAPKAIVLDSGASITAAGEQERRVRRQFVSIRAEALGTVRAFPQSLRKLNELFQALDHAVLFGGQSSVVYHRVRRGVEVMAKRTFGWRELGQILALYPESYSHEALQTTHEGRRVVSVVLTPKVQGLALASEIEARREEFAHRLMAHVDVAHRAFLVDRGYAPADLAAVEGHWHPSFDIESTPAVTPLQLPPAPAPSSLATFDRERLRHLLGAVPAAKPPAVLTLLPPTPADSPVLQPAATPAAARPPISGAKNLLERIREKQRAKEAALQAAVQAVPAATRTMHSRLPAILEAISFLFYSERRNVLPLLFVVDKLVESKDLERADLSRHIVALTEFVPEWCSIVDVGAAASSSKGEATGPPPPPQAPGAEPSPDARLAVTRTISMQEAKTRLAAKIAAVV